MIFALYNYCNITTIIIEQDQMCQWATINHNSNTGSTGITPAKQRGSINTECNEIQIIFYCNIATVKIQFTTKSIAITIVFHFN